jgi:hypothetical protein
MMDYEYNLNIPLEIYFPLPVRKTSISLNKHHALNQITANSGK